MKNICYHCLAKQTLSGRMSKWVKVTICCRLLPLNLGLYIVYVNVVCLSIFFFFILLLIHFVDAEKEANSLFNIIEKQPKLIQSIVSLSLSLTFHFTSMDKHWAFTYFVVMKKQSKMEKRINIKINKKHSTSLDTICSVLKK